MTETTRVSVAIELVGEPIGIKLENGILDLQMRSVDIECLPGDIPEHLTLDVAGLHLGERATVADLVYDRTKVKVLAEEQQIIASVLAPRLAETAAPAAEGEAPAGAEPEVIKKGKTEE